MLGHEEAVTELKTFTAPLGKASVRTYAAVVAESQFVADSLTKSADIKSIPRGDRTISCGADIYVMDEAIGKLLKKKLVTDPAVVKDLGTAKKSMDTITKYIPLWVKVAVAFALGCGTMIGWKRIDQVTVGSRKSASRNLTYAQGASAELMAAAGFSVIGLADGLGLPVSTTHVLASGIAGTMAANGSGLQKDTLISILLAWVLTLPVCVFLGATLFSASLYVMFHIFGVQ